MNGMSNGDQPTLSIAAMIAISLSVGLLAVGAAVVASHVRIEVKESTRVEFVPAPLVMTAVRRNTTKKELVTILAANPELISERDPSGLTLLHYAVDFARPDLVDLLLERGADPNATSPPFHEPPLVSVFLYHSQSEFTPEMRAIVQLLCDAGADPGDVQTAGTAVYLANELGFDDAVMIMSQAEPEAGTVPWKK